MITVWKNDIVRYTGEPYDGLTHDDRYRVVGGDYTKDADEPVIIWPAAARSGANEPWCVSWHVAENDLELVEAARCHCNFCDGAGEHPECPHNRPQVRPTA